MITWSEGKLEEATDQQPAPLDFSAVKAGEGSEHEGEALDQHPAPIHFDDVPTEGSEMQGDEKATCGKLSEEKIVHVEGNEGEGQHNHG